MTLLTLDRPPRPLRRGGIRRHAAAMLAGSLVAIGAGPAGAASPPSPSVAVVVLTQPGTAPAAAVEAVGGRVTRELRLVHGVAARVPAGTVAALRRVAGVRSAVRDTRFAPRTDPAVDPDAGLTLRQVRTTIGADRLPPAHAITPVDVAVVDTGVAPVRGLAGRILDAPDFSADGGVRGQAHLDAFGHGTHMAGIIGADDAVARLTGLAPASRVVNVRVADHQGQTTLSRLIAGIEWVVRSGDRGGYRVRVLNLAFGARSDGSYRSDPLAFAVERAWQRGIVVVAAAGNEGALAAGLDSPASDPYVIAVGAQDTVGTDVTTDDRLAEFSSAGTAERAPDVLAPGVGIVSLRVPGGFLDEQFPAARIGESWFRGSGTSQAAAVVSGAAALLLERRPDLSPDAVKALLRATSRPLAGVPYSAQGAGAIDVAAAAGAPAGRAKQSWPRARDGGAWRGRGLPALELAVEHGRGEGWSSRRWTVRRWSARRWTSDEWSSRRWTSDGWSSRRWTSDAWSARRWSGSAWQALSG